MGNDSSKLNNYKKLIVWEKSIELVGLVYSMCALLPKDELFGLSSQAKRAVVSIPANIAEGSARRNPKEFRQFLSHAFGSGAELETFIVIVKKEKMLDNFDFSEIDGLLNEVMKMLNKLIASVGEKINAK